MGDKRYTLTLTAEQLYALTAAFDANFGGGIEDSDPSKAERQVHMKLVRLRAKRHEDMRKAKADHANRPRLIGENRERALRNVAAGRRAGDDGDEESSN